MVTNDPRAKNPGCLSGPTNDLEQVFDIAKESEKIGRSAALREVLGEIDTEIKRVQEQYSDLGSAMGNIGANRIQALVELRAAVAAMEGK